MNISNKDIIQISIKTILLLVFLGLYIFNPLGKTFNLGLVGLIVAGLIMFFEILYLFLKIRDRHIGGVIGFLIGIIIYFIF